MCWQGGITRIGFGCVGGGYNWMGGGGITLVQLELVLGVCGRWLELVPEGLGLLFMQYTSTVL